MIAGKSVVTMSKKYQMEIAKGDDPCLRLENIEIDPLWFNTDVVISLIQDMIRTMHRVRGVGIAAPQVGINWKVAIALINKQPLVLINPQIVDRSKEVISIEEGCLSCPTVTATPPRSKQIEIEWYNVKGVKKQSRFDGINAIIIQHELDHLEGRLITDYCKNNLCEKIANEEVNNVELG